MPHTRPFDQWLIRLSPCGRYASSFPAVGPSETEAAASARRARKLTLALDARAGEGGAHRLRAAYFGVGEERTQQLFVRCERDSSLVHTFTLILYRFLCMRACLHRCERDFTVEQLRDVLRALQPVLDFELLGDDDESGWQV